MARLIVEVTRGERVESRHRGSIAVVAPSGELIASYGDPDEVVYIRSSAKPFQLAPFVASGRFDGYDFPGPIEALAVMAASHSGEDRHVRTVQALLRAGGLTRDVLACGMHAPYDAETAQRLIRDGEPLTPLRHNCSGKHAGMALHAKAAGWPIETYWQADHPIQLLALETVAALAGVDRAAVVTATDGCGVVTFGMPLRSLALAYARLADPSGVADEALGAALARIRDAMMAHPVLVAGERRRLDTALMRAAPGKLVSKAGAEGVQALGILSVSSDGYEGAAGVAIKIEDGDGAHRARDVSTCETLRQIGVLDSPARDSLSAYAVPAILDPRGLSAGVVRPAFRLAG